MYKYYFLKILSMISLTTAAHAGKGKLVLEATLSDEQTAVIKQKIIDPYVQHTTKTIHIETPMGFRHYEAPKTLCRYPSLKALEPMTYTTTLIFQADESEACKLANYYQNIMPSSLSEINVDILDTFGEDNYQQFHVDLSLPTTSNQVEALNTYIKMIWSQDKEYKLNSSGKLMFGKTTVCSKNSYNDDRGSLQLQAMKNKVYHLSFKNGRFSLTFKHFNLKYIDEDGKVIFSKPLELGQVAQ